MWRGGARGPFLPGAGRSVMETSLMLEGRAAPPIPTHVRAQCAVHASAELPTKESRFSIRHRPGAVSREPVGAGASGHHTHWCEYSHPCFSGGFSLELRTTPCACFSLNVS